MFLLFDIGGTSTRVAMSRDGFDIQNSETFPTPPTFDEGLGEIESFSRKIGGKMDAVAGGFPGTFDKKREIIIRAPNLPGWINGNIKERLQAITKSKVFIANDAQLAGLGEAVKGAGKDYDIVGFITVSTGIGGARIVSKKIDVASVGFEPGHQIIDADTTIRREYIRNKNGDRPAYLEDLISGRNIEKISGKKATEIDDPTFWDEVHWLLAVGLNNTIVHWSPEVIVIGGGLGKSNKISLEKLEYHLTNLVRIFPSLPVLKKSELGDNAGLTGALHFLKQNIQR